jgi:acyl-CoA thioester hydrolase
MPLDDDFNVRYVRVRMHHTDLMGAVYHGTFFDLFEEARTEVFRDLGYTYRDCVEGEGRLMLIVHASCDYKRPARMDDLLAIRVRVSLLSKARLGFRYDVTLAGSPEGSPQPSPEGVIAIGTHVFAFLAVATNRPTSVPPRFAELVRTTPGFTIDPEAGG